MIAGDNAGRTMPRGATSLNTTIFKSNVFCVLYALQIFDKALFCP